jgi:predicted GIY-YIG superfamily endonuclease
MHEETLPDNRIRHLYKITNMINQKLYIGQTLEPNKRWHEHKRSAAIPKVPIHFAIKKYGNHNFTFEVIAACRSVDDANHLETELVKQYDSYAGNGKGYNATYGGMNAPKTPEWCDYISKLQKQRVLDGTRFLPVHNEPHTPETIEKLRQNCNKPFGNKQALGYKHTPEAKAKMSAVSKGNKHSLGRKASEETKRKLSLAQTGKIGKRKYSEDERAAIIADPRLYHEITAQYGCSASFISSLKNGTKYVVENGKRFWKKRAT